jgi:CheY-like chemotaxis protein
LNAFAPEHRKEGTTTILYVEDEVLVRMATVEFLEKRGYNLIEADTADQALSILREGAPIHLVVTDIRTPGEHDGISLGTIISKEFPSIPVLFCSSHLDRQMEVPPTRFLRKPFSQFQLLSLIEEVIAAR